MILRRCTGCAGPSPRHGETRAGGTAFLHWLAGGSDVLSAAVSGDEALVLKLPPVSWMAPVSIPSEADPVEDDDDDPSDDDDIDEYEGEESFEGAQAAGEEEP